MLSSFFFPEKQLKNRFMWVRIANDLDDLVCETLRRPWVSCYLLMHHVPFKVHYRVHVPAPRKYSVTVKRLHKCVGF